MAQLHECLQEWDLILPSSSSSLPSQHGISNHACKSISKSNTSSQASAFNQTAKENFQNLEWEWEWEWEFLPSPTLTARAEAPRANSSSSSSSSSSSCSSIIRERYQYCPLPCLPRLSSTPYPSQSASTKPILIPTPSRKERHGSPSRLMSRAERKT
jgi:hypothetical protein